MRGRGILTLALHPFILVFVLLLLPSMAWRPGMSLLGRRRSSYYWMQMSSSSSSSDASHVCSTLVVCGPSGVGKGSMITKLLAQYSDKLSLSVSHTSRKPRPGEQEGLHYHFVSRESMEEDIASAKSSSNRPKFLELAEVHTNFYGTSLQAVENIHKANKVAILDVDTKGVQQIKATGALRAKYVFVVPPSMQVLEQRLRSRGTESEVEITTRMNNAKAQMSFGTTPGAFDVIIENGNLDATVGKLVELMATWFPTHFASHANSSSTPASTSL